MSHEREQDHEQAAEPTSAGETVAGTTRRGVFANLLRLWRRHGYILPSIVVATFLFGWLITRGDWTFLEPEEFSTYYDAHARGILHGRLDVDPLELAAEDFIFEGKHYGYFGSAPALIRVPLHKWFGKYKFDRKTGTGNFSYARPLMTAAFALGLAYVYGFLTRARRLTYRDEPRDARIPTTHRLIYSLLVVTAGLGTSALFMGSRAFVFHEAIMLAALFTLACLYNLLAYLEEPHRWGRAVTAGVWAALGLLTRATTGAGAEFGLMLTALMLGMAAFGAGGGPNPPYWLDVLRGVARRLASWAGIASADPKDPADPARLRPVRWRHAIVPAVMAVLGVGIYLGFNYAKFREFNGVPLKYYVRYLGNPTKLRPSQLRMIYTRNIPGTAQAYLSPARIHYTSHFPYVFMRQNELPPKGSRVNMVEPYASVTAASPVIALLALVGLVALLLARRPEALRWRVPVAAAIAGGGIVLATVAISERYAHDLYPALVICMALGVHPVLVRLPRFSMMRHGVATVFAVGCLYCVWANAAFAIQYQRELIWGMPAQKKLQYTTFRRAVDGMLGGAGATEPIPVSTTVTGIPPDLIVPGQIWHDAVRGRTLWFDGEAWRNPVGRETGGKGGGSLIQCKVAFREQPAGKREPLVSSGRVLAGDFVFVEHLGGHRLAFVFDHWGQGGPRSEPVEVAPGRLYDLAVQLDDVGEEVSVTFDGKLVMRHHTPIYTPVPGNLTLGENPLADFTGTKLDGVIFPLFDRPRPAERVWIATAASLAGVPGATEATTGAHLDAPPPAGRPLDGGQAAVDEDIHSNWLVPRSAGPVTLTIRPNGRANAQTLYLIGPQNGHSGWRRLSLRYHVGSQIGGQEFRLRDLAPGEVQTLRIGPADSDRFELTFSDPANDTPGYADVIIGWQ